MRTATIGKLKELNVIEKIYILVYFFLVLGTTFYFKIVGNLNEIWLLYTIIICYYSNLTYFFSKLASNNIYTEKYSTYIRMQNMQMLLLWSLLIVRLNLDLFTSIMLATIFLFFVGYSRSYFATEEFFRLISASISLCLQIYLQASMITSLFSLVFIIVYGRLMSEFFDKYVLKDHFFINNNKNTRIFYAFLWFYVKLANLRLGKRAIIFNSFIFTIFPLVWISFLFSRIYIPLLIILFMSVLLVSSGVYVKFVRTPLLSVSVFNYLQSKYPDDFQERIDQISSLILVIENYYIVDSEAYGVFSGSWLVKRYMDLKKMEFMHWSDCYIRNYTEAFINDSRDQLDIEIDDLLLMGLSYIKKTGNIERTEKSLPYFKAIDLLFSNIEKKRVKFMFVNEMQKRLSDGRNMINDAFMSTIEKFEELNKHKGVKVEPLLRSPGSFYFVSNQFFTIL